MAKCSECGASAWRLDMVGTKCVACSNADKERATEQARRAEAAQEAISARAQAMLMTTEVASSLPIRERLGIVSAEAVLGLNVFKDIMTDVRDLVGGRSATLEKAISDARASALGRLAEEAAARGADAVVGVSVSASEIGTRGQMLMLTAIGTAVRLSE